jgi:bifunctional enzyme CysN/CysC
VLWFTGLSGAGKSTIANLVEKKLHAMGRHTYLLDGDNVRHGLNKDLGFTDADRVENIRRVGEVAQADGRCRPDRADRVHLAVPRRAAMARDMMAAGEFIEVFVDTPLAVAEAARRQGPLQEGARAASSRTSPASTRDDHGRP